MKNFKIIFTLISVCLVPGISICHAQESTAAVPSDIRFMIDRIYDAYNKQDYTAMYRDFSTGRLRASDSFSDFKNKMVNIYDDFGKVLSKKVDYILEDSYGGGKFHFYRIQLDVSHKKGKTVQRLVLMQLENKNKWKIDGYAVTAQGAIYLAQGNLYNFHYKEFLGGLDDVWSSADIQDAWQDSRTRYLKSPEYESKLKEAVKKSLWALVMGDFNKSLRFISDPDQLGSGQYTAVEYYANGNKKWEISYLYGLRNGTLKVYYEDGTKHQIFNYKNGLLHGPFLEYYPDGRIKIKGDYKNGLPFGKAELFYGNGKIKSEFKFLLGFQVYTYKNYEENGNLEDEGLSVFGKTIKPEKHLE